MMIRQRYVAGRLLEGALAVGLFIIGALVWGMAVGWVGKMLLDGKAMRDNDWLQTLAGAASSLLGGTTGSLLLGEGLALRLGGSSVRLRVRSSCT